MAALEATSDQKPMTIIIVMATHNYFLMIYITYYISHNLFFGGRGAVDNWNNHSKSDHSRLTLNGSWDIDFLNLGNFWAFPSEIRHFEFSVSNEIVITLKLCTFLGGESKNHIKNWPWALETGLILN